MGAKAMLGDTKIKLPYEEQTESLEYKSGRIRSLKNETNELKSGSKEYFYRYCPSHSL